MDKVMKSAREFPLVLYQATEASSFLAYDNALMKGIDTDASTNATMSSSSVANATWWQPQLGNMPNVTLSSSQAPTFFSINGYVYAPGPAFEMCSGDDIIFYVYVLPVCLSCLHFTDTTAARSQLCVSHSGAHVPF